jgi:phage tail sheath protein FI
MQYLSPGVYVEEVPAIRPIAGVGTSTAGFLGVVMDDVDMPPLPENPAQNYPVAAEGEPQLVTNWEGFKVKFGDFQAKKAAWSPADYDAYRYFQLGVYGFFRNGGTRCWCVRMKSDAGLKNDIGAASSKTLGAFAAIDEIAMTVAPGQLGKATQDKLVDHCVKLEDRIAILDGNRLDAANNPVALTPVEIRGGANPTTESDYAAMYFPWLKVADPLDATKQLVQPPSGHVAGIYARSDATFGVHKAPANEVVRGAIDLERRLSKADQDGLNPLGINIIRSFEGNIKVWGARTLGGDNHGLLKYVSTRRYRNYLRESIDEGTQWVVFEPNTPDLWQRVKRSVSGFLTTEWSEGRLFGETADKAFFVKVDEENNPPNIQVLGRLIIDVGVRIVQPAEFVIFRLEQLTEAPGS